MKDASKTVAASLALTAGLQCFDGIDSECSSIVPNCCHDDKVTLSCLNVHIAFNLPCSLSLFMITQLPNDTNVPHCSKEIDIGEIISCW